MNGNNLFDAVLEYFTPKNLATKYEERNQRYREYYFYVVVGSAQCFSIPFPIFVFVSGRICIQIFSEVEGQHATENRPGIHAFDRKITFP